MCESALLLVGAGDLDILLCMGLGVGSRECEQRDPKDPVGLLVGLSAGGVCVFS